MATYETFAKIYDEVMDENLYLDWLDFTCRHLHKKQQNLLELACGTGILSVELANLGFNVTGLDFTEIVDLGTKNPAINLNIYDYKGSINVGNDADFAVVDKDFNVYMTINRGNIIYKK